VKNPDPKILPQFLTPAMVAKALETAKSS
jgi:hypothetical protein